MLRMISGLALLLASLAVQAGPAGDALHAFFAEVKSLRAEFTQELFDRKSGEIQRSSGSVAIQRPGRFRWDYRKPYEQLIVADGTKLWFYDPELEQVTVKSMDEGLKGTPALLLSEERPLEERFTIAELAPQDGFQQVELRPLEKESNFERIRILFKGGELARMEIIDSFGQVTRLVFSAVQRNVKLAGELFRFVPPPGVDVVGE